VAEPNAWEKQEQSNKRAYQRENVARARQQKADAEEDIFIKILLGFTIGVPLALIIFAFVFVIADSIGHANGIHQGTVTEKVYTAGHWPQWCIDSYGINNVENSCAGQYEQPSWKLTITKGEDENTFNVTEGQFNRTAEGATATFDKDDNLMENQ